MDCSLRNNLNFLSKEHFLYLKGLAIAAIFIGHIGNFSGRTWFTPLGGIGVAIFLFCSGYGLTKSYEKNGLKQYWRKKLMGVYVPFLLVELLFSLVLKRPFVDVLLDISLVKTLHPYGWYMQYLFVCYIIFWLLFLLVSSEWLRLFVLAVLSVGSFFVFENLQAEQALSFLFGVFLATLDCKGKRNEVAGKAGLGAFSRKAFLLLGLGLITFSVLMLAIKQLPAVREAHHYLLTTVNLLIKFPCAIGLVFATWGLHPFSKTGAFLGKISYPLYLLHGYFMFITSKRLFLGHFIPSAVLTLLASIAASVVLQYAILTLNGLIKRGRRR